MQLRRAWLAAATVAATMLAVDASAQDEPAPATPDVPAETSEKKQEDAKDLTDHRNVRSHVWAFSLTGKRHAWKSGKDNELLGNVAEVQIAKGYVHRSWYLLASLDIILGPYAPAKNKEINLDYYGTGFTAWWGFSTQVGNLRDKNDGYGFALGLNYSDIIGRNSSPGERVINDVKQSKVKVYQMRVASIAVMPAIFFSWLEPGRARGNKPELLSTRIEGYILTAGLAIPVHAPYQAKYDYIDNNNVTVSGREKGQFKGYSVVVSLQTLLGI